MGKIYAVLGGDRRQAYLARQLCKEGKTVLGWGLEESAELENVPLEQLFSAQVVILPLPLLDAQGRLNAPYGPQEMFLPELLDHLSEKQIICAGQIPAQVHQQAALRGLQLEDYFLREDLTLCNAAITAEGALAVAMEALPVTLQNLDCLILGFGRIGKFLSRKLQGLDAKVTVAARREEDFALASAWGLQTLEIHRLQGKLSTFGVLFNTVPAPILSQQLLEEVPACCPCIDLASSPGGWDHELALQMGVRSIRARGLPGKTAPCSAGAAIRNSIAHILEERGENE